MELYIALPFPYPPDQIRCTKKDAMETTELFTYWSVVWNLVVKMKPTDF